MIGGRASEPLPQASLTLNQRPRTAFIHYSKFNLVEEFMVNGTDLVPSRQMTDNTEYYSTTDERAR
jgi:hypothetical protein